MLHLLALTALACTTLPEVCFSPGGGCDRAIVDAVEHAERTVDVFAYALNRGTIVRALTGARRRGVAVRVLVDRLQSRNQKQAAALTELASAGIPVRTHTRTRIMHIKAVVADGRVVVYGSMNHTDPGVQSNDEVTTAWDCEPLARRFAEAFEARWSAAATRP